MRFRTIIFSVMWLFIMAFPAFAISPAGVWKFVQDSDGGKPKPGAVISISLAGDGSAAVRAEQPGETVEDSGVWSWEGKLVTIEFKEMEMGCRGKPFSINGEVLTLPFKVLGSGSGVSVWRRDASPRREVAAAQPTVQNRDEDLYALLRRTLAESEQQDNEKQRRNLDALAALALPDVKGGLAEAYYVQAVTFFMKSYHNEAWYGFAKAANLQPTNGVYLNNLSMLLMERGKTTDALSLLRLATAWFPDLDPLWGNLAAASFKAGDIAKAETAVQRAMTLSPRTGLYQYLYGKILVRKGRAQEAKKYFEQAWQSGYAGSGREGQPGGAASAGAAARTGGSADQQSAAASPDASAGSKPRPAPPKPRPEEGKKTFPPEWAGHYEAQYVRARSGEDAKEANTQFGQGMTGTNINLQTLACAKEFSMDISPTGSISGRGNVMFVYQGKAANPVAGLVPAVVAVGPGGFATNLKGGFQTRDWSFSGMVDADGNVEIQGVPSGQLDLLNVGKWQKISTWSPLPPDGPGAAMKGPFHMTLATGKESGPHIRVDQWLDLGDRLIRRVHYQAFIVKSDKPITPDCRMDKAPEATCPASEYLKTKVGMSSGQGLTVEASTTYQKGKDGVETSNETTTKMGSDMVNIDSTGKISGEVSKGMFTGSSEFNPTDGSYAVTVGIGIDTGSVLKDAPAGISQKIELVYDSKCGWGFKGTMGAKIGGTSAGVEGAVFFNKGI